MTTDDTHSLGEYLKRWRLQKGLPLELLALKTRIPLKYWRALEDNDFSTLPPTQALHTTLGTALRECRQQQGLSLEVIAEHTRIPLTHLQALEENDSLNLPAALVIARSYVYAYLDCLSLEEEQEQDVLLQFAKLVETVYLRPLQDAAPPPERQIWVGRRWTARAVQAAGAFIEGWHEQTLTAYLQLIHWRAIFCRRTASAGRAALTCLRQVGAASATAGRTTVHALGARATRLLQSGGVGKTQPAAWHHAVTAGPWQIRHSFVLMHRDTGSFSDHRGRQDQGEYAGGLAPSESSSVTRPFTQPLGVKMWVWVVQYGITILLLLLLGSMAANIPLFKETMLPDTKLDASHLVEFLGYSGALVMVWLMGRKAAVQLDRDRSGFSFLRPLVTPLTALLIASASYKVLLVLVNPFLDKSDRLTYNWIFVALIVASTLWLILVWFLKSAPMLESLETTGRAKPSTGSAASSACPHCSTAVPAGMKFCGQCGTALVSPQQ